jgi:hypothetical protein
MLKTFSLLLCAAAGFAQAPTATLVGRVVDASGAVIPAARIRIANTATGDVRRTVSSEAAEFTVPNLAPGTYEVTVEKEGFRTLREEKLDLQVDQVARLELKLEVGAVSSSVEVTAAMPVLNTESSSRGDVIISKEIGEIPLNGRDYTDLAFLTPGVVPRASGAQGSALSANGARVDNTNFIIDGVSNQNSRLGDVQARPPLDAVREFKMQVSGYSAEYGRLAGGVVNMALKSGTNRPHGVLFEFLRNDKMDARNFFDEGKSKLRRNQYGATLDGPVYIPGVYNGRNRTFFVASWEGYWNIGGSNQLGRVPSALERTGDFSQSPDLAGALADPLANPKANFPGNKIPLTRFSPIAGKILQYYPLPNRPGQANNLVVNANSESKWNSFMGKGDHRFSDANTVSARFMKRFNHSGNPFDGDSVGTFGNYITSHDSLAGLSFTHMFGPTLINELRTGMSRTARHETSPFFGTDIAAELGLVGGSTDPQLKGFPIVTVQGLFTLGPNHLNPRAWTVTNYQLGNTLTWVKAQHMIKLGADRLYTQYYEPYNNNQNGTYNFLGRWTNHPTADFLLGLLNNTSRQVGAPLSYLLSSNYGFFAQDDFKISPRLTLNLGLRYEIPMPMVDKYDRWSNFLPEFGKVALAGNRTVPNFDQLVKQAGLTGLIVTAGDLSVPRSLVYANYRDFAPRAGFAWRPFGGTRTVLRGGYGIFYATALTKDVRQNMGAGFPFGISQTFSRQTKDATILTFASPFPAAIQSLSGVTNTTGYELHPKPPYLQSWNFTIERELFASVALETAYVGSKGTHLGRMYNLNQPFRDLALRSASGSFPKPIPAFSTVNFFAFGSDSSYQAAVVSLRKNFSHGTFLRANYTFSKSIDDASQMTSNSDGGYKGAQDARNLRLEHGRSDWDRRHAFTMSFVTELPFSPRNAALKGWELAGTGRMYSGQPFTPQVANVNLDLGEANRPNRIANGRLDNPSPERWFDIAAFPPVPTGSFRFGNSGRNVLDGPGLVAVNLSLMKKFAIRESRYVQFRWEAFNISNHANFDLPVNTVDTPTAATLTSAGAGRSMQLALKYVF